VDEALGLIVSYEALLNYPAHPFTPEGVSAVTKLRAALPKDALGELERLRRHVAVVDPVREYEAPLLVELLSAAVEAVHLAVTYDSIRSGASERVIFPFGLYASQGFWYCACFDHKRGANVSMRADRFLAAERVGGFERPPHVPPKRWPHGAGEPDGERVRVRARVTERGSKSFELASLFARVARDGSGGGTVEAEIPPEELGYYASRLLSVGTDVIVESPPELVEAVRDKAREVARLYD
jgi:predicted DNA-binding transcriptional regulator YafY